MSVTQLTPEFCSSRAVAEMYDALPKHYFVIIHDRHGGSKPYEITVDPPDNVTGQSLCRNFIRTLYPDVPDEIFEPIYSQLMTQFTEGTGPRNFVVLHDEHKKEVLLVYIVDESRLAPDPFAQARHGMEIEPLILANAEGYHIAFDASDYHERVLSEAIVPSSPGVLGNRPRQTIAHAEHLLSEHEKTKQLRRQQKGEAKFVSKSHAQLEAETKELQKRKADVRVLENDIAKLMHEAQQEDEDDVDEIGVEIARLSAIKGQHQRRIQELELNLLPPPLPSVALANELQARRKDVKAIRKDLEMLHTRWREGEAEDEEANEIGADITRLSALKGQHERRIREIEKLERGASLTNDELITGAIQWLWDHRVHSQFAILHIMMATVHPRRPISLTDGLRAWKRHALQVEWIDNAIRDVEGPETPCHVSNVMFLNAVDKSMRNESPNLYSSENFMDFLVHPDHFSLSSTARSRLLLASAEQVGRVSHLWVLDTDIFGFDPKSCRVRGKIYRLTLCTAMFNYTPGISSVAFENKEHLHLLRQLREKLQRGWHIVGLPLRTKPTPEYLYELAKTADLIREALNLAAFLSQSLFEFLSVIVASIAGMNVDTLKEAFLHPNNKDNVLRMAEQGIDPATIDFITSVAEDYHGENLPLDLQSALSRPGIADLSGPQNKLPSQPPVDAKTQKQRERRRYDTSPTSPKAQSTAKPKSRSRSPPTTKPKSRSRSPREDESDDESRQ